jgi:hypothetical protein
MKLSSRLLKEIIKKVILQEQQLPWPGWNPQWSPSKGPPWGTWNPGRLSKLPMLLIKAKRQDLIKPALTQWHAWNAFDSVQIACKASPEACRNRETYYIRKYGFDKNGNRYGAGEYDVGLKVSGQRPSRRTRAAAPKRQQAAAPKRQQAAPPKRQQPAAPRRQQRVQPPQSAGQDHVVSGREWGHKIAKRYGIPWRKIKAYNNLTSDNLKQGQKLKIPPK